MSDSPQAEANSSRWRPSASVANLHARGEALARVREFFAQRQVLELQTPLLGAASLTEPTIQA